MRTLARIATATLTLILGMSICLIFVVIGALGHVYVTRLNLQVALTDELSESIRRSNLPLLMTRQMTSTS